MLNNIVRENIAENLNDINELNKNRQIEDLDSDSFDRIQEKFDHANKLMAIPSKIPLELKIQLTVGNQIRE